MPWARQIAVEARLVCFSGQLRRHLRLADGHGLGRRSQTTLETRPSRVEGPLVTVADEADLAPAHLLVLLGHLF